VGIRTGVYNQTAMLSEVISGSLLTLFLFDVSDEIRLDELRQVLNAPASPRQGGVRQPAPAYVGSHERGPIPSGAYLAELTDITRGKELLPPSPDRRLEEACHISTRRGVSQACPLKSTESQRNLEATSVGPTCADLAHT
jgi:hypothetical protein